ncbi:MAG: helix-turn-helix domain-containing protein [Thermodesulfobacteriota bacterium]
MKAIDEQTYYEILEVSPGATSQEIHRAYEHAKETFHAESLAVYSLFTQQEIEEIQRAVEEAYRVLMDEGLRKSYDQSHSQILNQPRWEKFQGTSVPLREKKPPSASADVSTREGEGSYRGKTLRQIRERMSIDLETIAQQTRISVKTLESIEAEDIEKLPALVYLKGFLKGYAQSLGLDPRKVVEEYLQFLEEEKKKRAP